MHSRLPREQYSSYKMCVLCVFLIPLDHCLSIFSVALTIIPQSRQHREEIFISHVSLVSRHRPRNEASLAVL